MKAPPDPSTLSPDERAMEQLLDLVERVGGASTVVFLGAGASKVFGYPVTRELMLKIFQSLQADRSSCSAGTLDVAQGQISEELHRFLERLLPGERTSEDKMPLVTAVLSLLDYSLSTGQSLLPAITLEETRRARQLLERRLLAVIPDGEWWKPNDEEDQRQEQYFHEARRWLRRLLNCKPAHRLAVVTTNYDMTADFLALDAVGVDVGRQGWNIATAAKKVDFGFRWINPENDAREENFPRPGQPEISLFKLHGSTNWLRCPLCENIYIHPNAPISRLVNDDPREDDPGIPSSYRQCHCSGTFLEPQIVSPSFVRDLREPNLVATWKSALDSLREADVWLMIGYSFPDEDVAIRALMTRAYGSKQGNYPTICVVQRGEKARVNYESFFPPSVVHYCTGGFDLLLDRAKARREARGEPL